MPSPNHDADLSDEDRTAADTAAESAFASSFADEGHTPREPSAREKAEKDATAKPDAKGDADATDDDKGEESTPPAGAEQTDPYASYPETVRQAIAAAANIPRLEQQLRSLQGRFDTQTKELKELKKTPKAAETPAAAAKREAVRQELPEVAEAMDELEARLKDAKAAQKDDAAETADAPTGEQEAAMDREAATLTEFDPDWGKKLHSTAFALWLSRQPQAYQDTIRSTTKAAHLTAALTKFAVYDDAARAEAQRKEREKGELEKARKNRVDGAAQPRRGNARPTDESTDDAEAAFAAGFNGT